MRVIELISARTTAAQSSMFSNPVFSRNGVVVCINSASGDFANAEAATIEYTTDKGTTWKTYKIGSTTQQLSATIPCVAITGPLYFRVNKGSTAASVGVSVIL